MRPGCSLLAAATGHGPRRSRSQRSKGKARSDIRSNRTCAQSRKEDDVFQKTKETSEDHR